MTDAPRHSWQCPSCLRRIPHHVDTCRCGSERHKLEALGYAFDEPPATEAGPAPDTVPARRPDGPAARLLGYRADTSLGATRRLLFKGLALAAVAVTAVLMVQRTHADPPPLLRNVDLTLTLDDHTRTAGPDAGNTIPAFISSPGTLGIVRPTTGPSDVLEPVDQVELLQGFCSPNIAAQVRHAYPGFYDDWPDDKLAPVFLEKYPEYEDRLCVLSTWLEASPSEIVKYELRPRSLAGLAWLWLRTLGVTALVALGVANAYFRLVVGRLAGAVPRTASPLEASYPSRGR